jgi:hypothetical protein
MEQSEKDIIRQRLKDEGKDSAHNSDEDEQQK